MLYSYILCSLFWAYIQPLVTINIFIKEKPNGNANQMNINKYIISNLVAKKMLENTFSTQWSCVVGLILKRTKKPSLVVYIYYEILFAPSQSSKSPWHASEVVMSTNWTYWHGAYYYSNPNTYSLGQ